MRKLVLTTFQGLEEISAKEVEQRGFKLLQVFKPSLLLVEGDLEKALQLKTVDSASQLLHLGEAESLEVKALRLLFRQVFKSCKGSLKSLRHIRVRAVTRGRGVDRRLLELIASREAKRVAHVLTSPRSPNILRVYLDTETNIVIIAQQLHKQPLHLRDYYVAKHPSPLNPIIAASIPYFLGNLPRAIYDPFCGSGTIPIEVLLQAPEVEAYASDIEPAYVKATLENAEQAGVALQVFAADAAHPPIHRGIDLVAADPPRGRRLWRGSRVKYLEVLFKLSTSLEAASLLVVTPYEEPALKISEKYEYFLVKRLLTFQGGARIALLHFKR